MTVRHINQAGLELIKAFEGIMDGDPSTVNLDPYLCPAKIATIGWGHAVVDPVSGVQCKGEAGLRRARQLFPNGITLEEAEALLRRDLIRAEWGVERSVTVPLTENQFSALVSFLFNLGATALLGTHTLALLLTEDYRGFADAMLQWNKGGGVVLPGLVRRRLAERKLFLTP